jgi:hypothetical protein
MATVSTVWPGVAAWRVIEVTVPEKMAPAARAIKEKSIVPSGLMGKWRRSWLDADGG